MTRGHKPIGALQRSKAIAPSDRPRADLVKTTLYLPRPLHAAAKRAGIDAGASLNAVFIEALEAYVDTAQVPRSNRAGPVAQSARVGRIGDSVDALAAVHALAARLTRVEQALGSEPPTTDVPPSIRPMSVQQVREVVRDVLLGYGGPMSHRALFDHLVQERGLTLPGQDPSENLRTILVHPKSTGFTFARKRGYWVDDLPMPGADAAQGQSGGVRRVDPAPS